MTIAGKTSALLEQQFFDDLLPHPEDYSKFHLVQFLLVWIAELVDLMS